MESIPQDSIFEFNPDTLLYLRKQYELDKPGRIEEAINILEEWIKKQNHFAVKEFPRDYLERSIIISKGSVERAKAKLDKICTFRTIFPHFFEEFDAKNSPLLTDMYGIFLPKLTKDHYRVYFYNGPGGSDIIGAIIPTKLILCYFVVLRPSYFRGGPYKFGEDLMNIFRHGERNSSMDKSKLLAISEWVQNFGRCLPDYKSKAKTLKTGLLDYYRYFFMQCEYIQAHDYCNGMLAVLDYTDANLMELVKWFNVVDLREGIMTLKEGYGMRIKGIHLISGSKAIDAVVAVFKQVLSAKLAERMFVHKSMDEIGKYIEKDIIPVEYGGNEKPLLELHKKNIDVLTSDSFTEYLRGMRQARTNEKLRLSTSEADQYLGISGSFRTLNVD